MRTGSSPAPITPEAFAGFSDEEIARRVLAGEPALFELLMRRHNQKVYRAVRSLLSDEDEVEDAMQQAYVSAYLNLGQREGRSTVATWLVRIAINEGLQRLRKKKRLVSLDTSEENTLEIDDKRGIPAATPEDAAARGELAGFLQGAVESLADSYRLVFMLREVEGMSTQETADALDLSEDVVKTRLHRAKAMLQERVLAAARAPIEELFPFHAVRCDRVVHHVMARIADAAR